MGEYSVLVMLFLGYPPCYRLPIAVYFAYDNLIVQTVHRRSYIGLQMHQRDACVSGGISQPERPRAGTRVTTDGGRARATRMLTRGVFPAFIEN